VLARTKIQAVNKHTNHGIKAEEDPA
jgi:hypothetical protein